MTVNAPARPYSGTMDVEEFMAFLETRPKEERWHLIEGTAEIAIRLPGVLNFQPEPDVVVAPGTAGYELYAEDFRLVAEIFSPSNTRIEMELKFRRYREAPGNLYALIIEPRELLVEIHAKNRNWQPPILKQPGDPIEMPEFGLRCPVGDLYRGTPLDPQNRARA